ncbi:MAG: hypothetical protein H6868_07200 [Rhodospirillales bacterium]|nr:hypothetical protein [Rhodospirillales bacterium]
MSGKGTENTPDKVVDSGFSDATLDPEVAHEAMAHLMDHYLNTHQMVMKKLCHARDATQQRLDDIESAETGGVELAIIQQYKQLGDLWTSLVALFERSALSVEEMEAVDGAIGIIPKSIKRYYDTLVRMDTDLMALITKMASEEYQTAYHEAKKVTEKVQQGRNLLSGLSPDEYEPAAARDLPTSAVSQKWDVITLPNGQKLHLQGGA